MAFQFYLGAASKWVQEEAERRGVWQTLMDSGARPLPPDVAPASVSVLVFWRKAKLAFPQRIAISRAAWDRVMPNAISRAPK